DLRSVSRAADLLNVSQPAVSKGLAEIERGVGVVLFDRGKRGLIPTLYGECLIRLCRTMLQSLDSAGEELRHLQAGAAGRVRIGVLPVAAPVLVPHAVIRLQRKAPRAVAVLHEATADRLLPMLREGGLDLIVGTVPPASQSSGLRFQLLHPGEDVAIVCGSRHPLARSETFEAADLLHYPLVIPPLSTLFRESVEQFMDALKLPRANVRIESGSMTATNTLLRETDAIGFYSPHLAQHYAKLGWLKVLPVEAASVRLPIGCFWLRGVELDATARLLVGLLRDVAGEFLTRESGKPSC
ncbi:MAG: LysR family transcriptional regulator, partial [Myxococcales bacterium]|nr:LysR family transcriptional regulator [Myxococcales bacterium]